MSSEATQREARLAPTKNMIALENPIKGLIFTAGCQRSGTSMVHRLLSGHPDVHGVHTEWGLIFDRYDSLAQYTGIKEPKTTADVVSVLAAILPYSHHQKWDLDVEDVADLAERFEPSWDAVFLTAIAGVQRKSGDKLVALKRPEREGFLPKLKALFDGMDKPIRFVYCVRHPFDVYLSWKHRLLAWRGRDEADPRPARWCNSWLKSIEGLLAAHYMFADQICVVRFEDVIANPEIEVTKLCEFLRLDSCVAEMVKQLDSHQANSSFQKTTERPKVAGGVIDMNSRDRELADWEADAIRELCGDHAKLFGYDLGASQPSQRHSSFVHQMHLETVPTMAMLKHGSRIIARRVWSTRLFGRKQAT
jgi:hypothetical protein